MIWFYCYVAAAILYGLMDKDMVGMRAEGKRVNKYGSTLVASVLLSLAWPVWFMCDVAGRFGGKAK